MSKLSKAVDSIGIGIHNTGVRLAGRKGAKVARVLSDILIGRHLEECGPECGDCGEVEMLQPRGDH